MRAEKVEDLLLAEGRVGLGRSQRGTAWPLKLHPRAAKSQSIQRAFQKQLACQDIFKKESLLMLPMRGHLKL